MTRAESNISCREFCEFVMDYLEKRLPEEQKYEFDLHLKECPYCVDYLKSYRQTIDLTADQMADADAPPEDAPQKLIEAIFKARKKTN